MALQCAFNDFEESAFSVDEISGRSKKKKSKKKMKVDKCRRRRSGDSKSRSSKHCSQLPGCSKLTERRVKNKCKHCKDD
jgi:hypothetical protein